MAQSAQVPPVVLVVVPIVLACSSGVVTSISLRATLACARGLGRVPILWRAFSYYVGMRVWRAHGFVSQP